MKSIFFVALFVSSLAKYYHDLDDQQHVAMITESGINLSRVNNEAYLKITSNNGSTGYSWLIDTDACEAILDIDTGYVYHEADDDTNFGVGYGEEIFTLKAEKYGKCVFRLAYARSWEFVDFETHRRQNGYLIEIPINVLTNDQRGTITNDGSGTDTTNSGTATWVCNEGEDCSLREEMGITVRHYKAYRMLGVMSWVRSTLGLNPVGHLPLALGFLGTNRESATWANVFLWSNKYYTQIAGWIMTFIFFILYFVTSFRTWYLLFWVLSIDGIGWMVYYFYRIPAYQYAYYVKMLATEDVPEDRLDL